MIIIYNTLSSLNFITSTQSFFLICSNVKSPKKIMCFLSTSTFPFHYFFVSFIQCGFNTFYLIGKIIHTFCHLQTLHHQSIMTGIILSNFTILSSIILYLAFFNILFNNINNEICTCRCIIR